MTIDPSYLRVTEILSFFVRFEDIPEDKLEGAKLRGTAGHFWINDIYKSRNSDLKITLDDLDEQYRPWGESFLLWWKENEQYCVGLGERLFDHDLGLTGEPDMRLFKDGRYAVVDFKLTCAISKSWELQLSAYDHLLEKNGIPNHDRIIVHLSKVGKEPKIIEYKNNKEMFFKCFDTYKYFHGKKTKKK